MLRLICRDRAYVTMRVARSCWRWRQLSPPIEGDGTSVSVSTPHRRSFSTKIRGRKKKQSSSFSDELEYTNEWTKDEPWKTLLLVPARAGWRVASPKPPRALEECQKRILDQASRSNKILQGIHREIMASHKALILRRERERKRAFTNKEYRKADQKRDAADTPVLYGPEEALASFKFRLYPTYTIVQRILREAKSLVGHNKEWSPRRVIDFGIGCGGASAAAMDVWDDIEWIHGIDPSQTMREGAKAFLEDFGSHNDRQKKETPRVTLSSHLSAEAAPASFDLALFAYTATEIPGAASTLAAAAILWEKLLPNGIFVMIEPGTPDGFSSTRTVRSMLLKSCPPNSSNDALILEQCHILAPCTHNGKCPIERFRHLTSPHKSNRRKQSSGQDGDHSDWEDDRDDVDDDDDDDDDDETNATDSNEGEEEQEEEEIGGAMVRRRYCSFVHAMPGGSGRSKGEKFSYLVAQKRVAGEPDVPSPRFDGANLVDLLNQTTQRLHMSDNIDEIRNLGAAVVEHESQLLDFGGEDELGLEFLRGDVNRSSFGRIVHAPKKKRAHVLIDCCTGPGQIVRHKITKSMAREAPGLYAAARKSRWGGFWPNMDSNENDKGIN